MVSLLVQRARWLSPIVASTAVVLTLVICVIITKVRGVYTGGLKWPYFSDMGRDSPGYYVFCVGLTITAIALICTWWFNYQFQRSLLRKPIENAQLSRAVLHWAKVHTTLGMISVLGLPTLAFFSTASYSSIHNSGAYWFFFLETFAIAINTVVSYKIHKIELAGRDTTVMGDNPATVNDSKGQRYDGVHRTFLIQACTFVLFFIAFLLYLPIGLSVVKTTPRLTVQECLNKNLGQKYCTVTMRLDETRTKLWNYEDDFAVNQMRAAAQLCCIVTLVGYSISFISHDYSRVEDSEHYVEAKDAAAA